MLDLNSSYPEQEEYALAVNRAMANIRDNLSDLELIFKMIFDGKTYIDAEQVCEILHCKKNDIPIAIPKYRVSKTVGYLYKLKEVYDFIESRRTGK